MTKFLENIYRQDLNRKNEAYDRLKKKNGGEILNEQAMKNLIHNGTKVLIEFPQPPGESTKTYNAWKGIYVVVKQIDKNSYLVGHLEGTRRKFLVHRRRIRPLPEEGDRVDREVSPVPINNDGLEEELKSQNTEPVRRESPVAVRISGDDTEKTSDRGGSVEQPQLEGKISRQKGKKSRHYSNGTSAPEPVQRHAMTTRNRKRLENPE